MRQKLPEITVIANDLRSAHNVGAILRTCDGLGVRNFVACGTTPYPDANEKHLPHVVRRVNHQIAKTALGAEKNVHIRSGDIHSILQELKSTGTLVCALEQAEASQTLRGFHTPSSKIALIIGNEVDGIAGDILDQVDTILEIPMVGTKESFNVAAATAICLWQLTY